MPQELLIAHQNLDRAVMKLYGFSVKDTTEASCVAALMELYQNHIESKPAKKFSRHGDYRSEKAALISC